MIKNNKLLNNKFMIDNSTICAIATASGSGAIAIIRLSGNEAINIADKIFVSKSKKKLIQQKANSIHYGEIKNETKLIDEVLVSVFKSPHSYTGENSIEISCHGSLYIQQKILNLLVENGARVANPGEFTQRAYLNGKMDLSQAEAVADLIASSSESSHKIALNQMRGSFSNELSALRNRLLNFTTLIELELDFSEEDVEFADRKQLIELINNIEHHIKKLIDSFTVGNTIKQGIPVAIIGEPNVGKSTLLNILVKEDRAIVSNIPGTTRDTIEDTIVIDGILFRFIDTAGLRNTDDYIENLGIERTQKIINIAEIVILVVEPNSLINKLYPRIQNIINKNKKIIIAINKIDTYKNNYTNEQKNNFTTVYISAKKEQNIDKLISNLVRLSGYNDYNEKDVIVTNTRHYEALEKSYKSILRVIEGLENQLSGDFIAQDIREVLHYLGEITGNISTDEILGNIFNNFCIGK